MNPSFTAQRRQALSQANEVRSGRAQLMRDLKAGATTLSEALEHPHAQSMALSRLLLALPGVGEIRVRRMLLKAGLSTRPRARVEDLAECEREKLLEGCR